MPPSIESDYKLLIIADVQRSISAVNGIVVLLQGYQGPVTSSELIEKKYPQATLGKFLTFSSTIVESLGSAHSTVTTWLIETGDRLMKNVDEGQAAIDASIKQTTLELGEANHLMSATEERTMFLNTDISNLNATLDRAEMQLNEAEDLLRQKTQKRDLIRSLILGSSTKCSFAMAGLPQLAAMAKTSFAAVVATVDRVYLQAPVDEQKDIITRITLELDVLRGQLQEQTANLEKERAESARVSAHVAELRQKEKGLTEAARVLEKERAALANLSKRINDCLRSVNVALTSAANLSVVRSMQEVVLGLRGVVSALGQDTMFSGPLAQLDDTAFTVLDRRMASVRRNSGRVAVTAP
ncbi:hypothetical protein V8D89_011614 [Ganoderma adspersum]